MQKEMINRFTTLKTHNTKIQHKSIVRPPQLKMPLVLTFFLATSQAKALGFSEAFEFQIKLARVKEVKAVERGGTKRAS